MIPKAGLSGLMSQIKKAQEKVEQIQKELETITVEGSAGGEMVKVTANGKQEIIKVEIDPEILSDDVEMLEDMVAAATNQALQKAQEISQEKMSAITGGILPNLPPGFKIPGL